jgi:hypothetical protein
VNWLTNLPAAAVYIAGLGGEQDMKTAAFRKIDVVVLAGLSVMALIIVTLGAQLVHTQPTGSSRLGSGWKCHRLPYVEICNRAV